MDPSPAERVLTEHEVDVTLSDGRHIIVLPWGYTTTKRMIRRLATVMKVMTVGAAGGTTLGALMAESFDEVGGIVADSIGWEVEDFDVPNFLAEDFINLANAVIDVNFLKRPALKKALTGLVARVEALQAGDEVEIDPEATLATTISESPLPSSSSTDTDPEK